MKRGVARGIRWLVTAAIIVFLVMFARTIDWSAAWASMRNASLPVLLAATLVNFLSLVVRGVRWWLFLRAAGSPSLALAVRATIAGAGLNNVLVANGGDAARVIFVARATGIPTSTVLATLALERLFDSVGFVVLLVYGVTVFDLPPALEKWTHPAEGLLVVVAGLLVWFVFVTRNATTTEALAEAPGPRGSWQRIKAYLARFAMSARSLATGPRFIGALVLAMVAWVGQIATFQLAAVAAHIAVPPAGSLAALLLVNLGFVFRATPGNVGLFQLAYVVATEPFGVSRADAIVVSLLTQTIQILPVTVLGVALAPEFIFRRSRNTTGNGVAKVGS